jgi:hypothetical protein
MNKVCPEAAVSFFYVHCIARDIYNKRINKVWPAAAHTENASFLQDVLYKIDVCDACRCGRIRRKGIIVEGCP